MADQADVERALVAQAVGVFYPAGAEAGSVLGVTARVYRGWPNAAALDGDLRAGRVNVTVFPDDAPVENTTRWPEHDTPGAVVEPTLGVLVAGDAATFFGSAAPGQVAGLLVDTQAVACRVGASDTPELVAAVLAERLRHPSDGRGRVVLVSGATVRVPGAGRVIGRVAADQPVTRELRRQRQWFRLSAWCPSVALRDAACATLDAGLAGVRFLALADGTAGYLRYERAAVVDQSQNARLWRRDLVYSVEYATTLALALPTMLFGTETIAANGGPVVARRLS